MTDVAKVREALERLKPPPIQPGTLHHDVIAAFVDHGLKVCDAYQAAEGMSGLEEELRHTARLGLIAAILRDAGLLEEGR